ncbi:hypothetical protein TRFO_23816 [Tritrichomonas foetus]|uniref:Sulfatase N-terminal domain-containing protein n=1 Tax=Tritrichomonas foetus TaxID=1144522 RepID=A0A1J4KA72_9EUKA|nr:hypothetical protein TRFO_23816 [Tritrichomonas foetus]|eukprot:OHT07866.1 hypothetical protein TRFO_23816 [Tritrichomonas foetus]
MFVDIPFLRITYLIICISFFELIKTFYGQPLYETGLTILFFLSVLLTFSIIARSISILIFMYEMLDGASWIFTHSGLSLQVIMAFDSNWCGENHYSFIIGLCILIVSILIMSFNPFIGKKIRKISFHQYVIFMVAFLIFLYPFVTNFYGGIFPFDEMGELPPYLKNIFFNKIEAYLKNPIQVNFSNQKKNLIILEIESLEQQILGRFNKFYPEALPFLSNLSKHGLFVQKMESQRYTAWSVASLFAAQCNLPLLMTQNAAYNSARFHMLDQHRCVGDYLNKSGYHLVSYLSNVFIGKFRQLLEKHHWIVHDFKSHGYKLDWELFNFLGDSIIPNLSKKENQPFVLHIANADTHPYPKWTIDKRCKNRFPHYSRMMRSFDCVDQILEGFMDKVKKSGILKNTEVVIYGDHILMGRLYKGAYILEPRNIVLMLPFRKDQVIRKPTTIYDLAPTFMDVIGADYSPHFPFGASLLSKRIGIPPSGAHLRFIYDYFSSYMKWNKNMLYVIPK